MTDLEILQLLVKAKELGLSMADVEAYKTKAPAIPETKAEDVVKPLSVLDEMDEEEILYYATPYYDELQARKAAISDRMAQDQLEEDKARVR